MEWVYTYQIISYFGHLSQFGLDWDFGISIKQKFLDLVDLVFLFFLALSRYLFLYYISQGMFMN
tara:strand:+ start:397 stop:588 length:192 start_codon:yes stop_codon:yes gene_type:complete